jgi:hypothetical protein
VRFFVIKNILIKLRDTNSLLCNFVIAEKYLMASSQAAPGIDAQNIVKSFAKMKTLELAQACAPQLVTSDLIEKTLDNQALRSVLARHGGTAKDIADLSLSATDLSNRIAAAPSIKAEDAPNIIAKLVATERQAMEKPGYRPPELPPQGPDGKPQSVVPRIGDIALHMVPDDQKAAMQQALNQGLGIQAAARSFYKATWPNDDTFSIKASIHEADPASVQNAQKRLNALIDRKNTPPPMTGAEMKQVRVDAREDLAALLKESGMMNTGAALLGRTIGALPVPGYKPHHRNHHAMRIHHPKHHMHHVAKKRTPQEGLNGNFIAEMEMRVLTQMAERINPIIDPIIKEQRAKMRNFRRTNNFAPK